MPNAFPPYTMPDTEYRLLVVESDSLPLQSVVQQLEQHQFRVFQCRGVESACQAVAEQAFDGAVVAADLKSGINQLNTVLSAYPVLWLTSKLSERTTAERLGVPKEAIVGLPIDPVNLAQKVRDFIQSARSMREKRQGSVGDRSATLIGESPNWMKVDSLARRMASNDENILITGPTGTGKTALAYRIHQNSLRRHGPFEVVNLPAVPKDLQIDELFGHFIGSFTGAEQERVGAFLQASGGTLFIDEVGELTGPTQTALLRAVQEKRVKPVGGKTEFPVNVRLIFASNQELQAAAREGDFRSDLLYRLATVVIDVPPLKDRPEDLLPLGRFFAERFGREKRSISNVSLSHPVEEFIQLHSWPGNVRELEQFILSGVLFLEHGETKLQLSHFTNSLTFTKANYPSTRQSHSPLLDPTGLRLEDYLDECTRSYLTSLIGFHRGDWDAIARSAGYKQVRTIKSLATRLGLLAVQEREAENADERTPR